MFAAVLNFLWGWVSLVVAEALVSGQPGPQDLDAGDLAAWDLDVWLVEH